MVVRIIDTETTGFSLAQGAEVVEIASVDLLKREDGSLYAGNHLHSLVRPAKPIPPETSAIHHIIDEDVADAPLFGDAVKPFLGADVYVAHNAKFDRDFLVPLQDLSIKWICTLKVAKRLWPDAPSHTNQAIRYMLKLVEPFGIKREDINPHRADSDVTVTAAILAHIIENRLATFAQMLEWSAALTHMPTCPIGKHKGKKWADIDGDYLAWLIKSDMDGDIKANAKAELDRRKMPSAPLLQPSAA